MMSLKQKLTDPSVSQSGFTLIECLLAIIIVSLLLVAVSPAIVLSVATRVQARRVELATQAAASYVDAIRAGTLPPPPPQNTVQLPLLPPAQPGQPSQPQTVFPQGAVPAPTGTAGWTCNPTYPTTGTQPVYCFDGSSTTYLFLFDIDSKPGQSKGDFIIQPFRSAIDANDNGSKGYILGVRVYRADAFDGSVTLKSSAGGARRAATHTGGVGDRSAPVIEMTTAIRPAATSGGSSNYNSLKERLGVKSSVQNPNPASTPPVGGL